MTTTKNVDPLSVKDEPPVVHQLTAGPENDERNSDEESEVFTSLAEKLQISEEKNKSLKKWCELKIQEIKGFYELILSKKEENIQEKQKEILEIKEYAVKIQLLLEERSKHSQARIAGLEEQLEANLKHYKYIDNRRAERIALLEQKIKIHEENEKVYKEEKEKLLEEKSKLEKYSFKLAAELNCCKAFLSEYERVFPSLAVSQDETDGTRITSQEWMLSYVVFGGPKPEIFPNQLTCKHSCVTLSYCFIWCMSNPDAPLCPYCLVKEATRRLNSDIDQQIFDCKNAVYLFRYSDFLVEGRTISNINHVEDLNQAIREVTWNTTHGLLGFSYHEIDIGHCVAYWVTDNNKLRVFDPQKWKWWRESDYRVIKAVSCFQVNTATVQSVPRGTCVLPVADLVSL